MWNISIDNWNVNYCVVANLLGGYSHRYIYLTRSYRNINMLTLIKYSLFFVQDNGHLKGQMSSLLLTHNFSMSHLVFQQ